MAGEIYNVCFTIVCVLSFVSLLIIGPDIFLRNLLNSLSGKEKADGVFDYLSRMLGWIERALFFLSLSFLPSQFIAFVGIWFALKVVGSFNAWQPTSDVRQQWHDEIFRLRRARFMIFSIGTGLSLFWTVSLILISLYILNAQDISISLPIFIDLFHTA